MLLVRSQFTAPIWWRIETDDPLLLPLPQTCHWLLVNPILYSQLPMSEHSRDFLEVIPSSWLGPSLEIILATSDEETIRDSASGGWSEALLPVIDALLLRLRHFTGQATLPKPESVIALTQQSIEEIPAFIPPSGALKVSVQEYLWRTAVTSEHVRRAAAYSGIFAAPTHEALFLDAVEAHTGKDYRKAILYAAMSAEIALGTKIDAAYANILTTQPDERFRVIQRPRHGATPVYKDPIYEKLRPRADFKVLINELALYVLRRSLISENEDLYVRALRMYNTRNQLAHAGELDESSLDKAYRLAPKGSMLVLKTAIDLFAWLGERADFSLPTIAFVSSKDLAGKG